MLQSTAVIILLLLFATSNGLYRLPLKRYQRSVQSLANRNGTKIPLSDIEESAVNLLFTFGVMTSQKVELEVIPEIWNSCWILVKYGVVAEIQVGHKKDVFYVLLNTGSSEIFLPSVNCKSCGNHTAYKCAEDSNFTVDVKYVLGEGTGRLCVDNITIGGLTVQNQHFVVMEEEDSRIRSHFVHGFLGLGFSSFLLGRQNTSDYPYVPMEPSTDRRQFLEENEVGEVIFGGFDPSRYTGNLSYADVIPKQSAWKVNLEGFMIGSHNVGRCDAKATSQCSAVIDTGKRDIWVPVTHVVSLMVKLYSIAPSLITDYFQSNQSKGFNLWVKSQDVPNLEPIHIYIAGEKFTLQPSAYLIKADDDLYFLKLLVSNLDHWILGETFLRSMYTVFDVQNLRIGFAPAV